jgi:hypothetical protein
VVYRLRDGTALVAAQYERDRDPVRKKWVRCASPPANAAFARAFANVCAAHGVNEGNFLKVAQADHAGHLLDTEDRVQLGAAFVRDLAAADL